jgi:hypothetical protein
MDRKKFRVNKMGAVQIREGLRLLLIEKKLIIE